MLNLGMGEMILVAIVALLLIPPQELPRLATSLGRFLASLRHSFNKVKTDLLNGGDGPDKSGQDQRKDGPHGTP